MSMNFRDAMKTKLEDIPVPPLPPVGTYRFRISKQPIFGDAGGGRYETLTFPCQAQEGVTVDADELQEFGDVKAINLSVRFMTIKDPTEEEEVRNARTLDQLRNFLTKHLGLSTSVSMAEAIDEAVGGEFLGELSHRPDKDDPEKIYAEIRKTAPLV